MSSKKKTNAFPEPRWSVQAACLSDVGRVRQQNQDQCAIVLEHALFIVSDGMGGHHAGEIAAQVVVTVLPLLIEQHMARVTILSSEAIEAALRDAIVELSRRLRTESAGHMGLHGMGATVALVWLHDALAHLAHMGDSRIYLLRQEQFSQLTEDHSVVALLLRHGDITPEEAQSHSARGQISRYVGMEGDVYPDVQTVSLQENDRLLLCSDGLTNLVSDTQIVYLLRVNAEPEAACQALISAANTAGGLDNITALVVNCGR
jgi:protein phosphatase